MERETTAVVRPGWTVDVAADGSLIVTKGGPNMIRVARMSASEASVPESARIGDRSASGGSRRAGLRGRGTQE